MKFAQQPHAVFMVRPCAFGFNAQTSSSNVFQKSPPGDVDICAKAIGEFNAMVEVLSANEIDVLVFDDTHTPPKPDAIFPNNWISTHHDGTVIIYPMMSENRRWERRTDIVEMLNRNYRVTQLIDLSHEERTGKFLEGTGSLVFDHANKTVFACRSPRTNEELVNRVAQKLNYKTLLFFSVDGTGKPIYHTNVMMCVGEKFAVLCLDSIPDDSEQELLLESFSKTGHKVIAISFAQMNSFAGNMISVESRKNEPHLLLSQSAFESLLPGQIHALSGFVELLPIKVDTIQSVGGGSVRCMVAGIHLPKRNPF
jgi:hypothetical protein